MRAEENMRAYRRIKERAGIAVSGERVLETGFIFISGL